MLLIALELREELKPENLSFTAIAKRVGERWQDIPAEEKEPYESEASAAKEKYHAEMAEYKTTKSYREYQQYLAEFKAKHASSSGTYKSVATTSIANLLLDGKRPKLTPEETQESTTSSGSVVSQLDGPESASGSTDLKHRRDGSVSSGGLHSVASGLPSPASVTAGTAVRRAGLSSIIPLGNTSPLAVSPSTPAARRETSTSQLFHKSAHGRLSAERQSERMITSSGSDLNYARVVPVKSQETSRTMQDPASGLFTEPRVSRARREPLEIPRRSARIPTQLPYNLSDSSKSSTASTLSSSSSAPSSLYSPATFDGEKRLALSLPPLATLGPDSSSNGSSYDKQAARPALQPLAGRTASSLAQDQPSQTTVSSSSSTGMKFESLQLPLPYNISFGQHPLPRSDSGGKLANIFDLQDIPRERGSLRELSLGHEQGGTNPRSRPEPRHPPHHPNLPSLPSLLRDENPDSFPHNADPLSVLAYAGRIVGRERETPRPP